MVDSQATTGHLIIADWVKIIISGVVGFFLARLGDVLKTRSAESEKKRKMRKALYVEIIQHFVAFKTMLEIMEGVRKHAEVYIDQRLSTVDFQGHDAAPKIKAEIQSEILAEIEQSLAAVASLPHRSPATTEGIPYLAHSIRFLSNNNSYKYAKSNPDIFYELSDALAIDACYANLQMIVTNIEAGTKDLFAWAKDFVQSIDNALDKGYLDKSLFDALMASLYNSHKHKVATKST